MAAAKKPGALGEVQRVLQSPRIEPPPKTLAEAREAPGRAERIAEIAAEIEREGIEYVFFQQVSVSGHINGKGVVASYFSQVAERGYQLVYGATADLFTDRQENYIGFGPEESELAAIADLSTFRRLPWDPRVARVYCDCYDTETGELLDADPRQNLKRIAHDVEEELGYSFLCGIEPEMMWLKRRDEDSAAPPEGVTKPWCYHINQFEQLRPVILDVVSHGKAMGLDMSYGDHEDAPGQLELNFRFDRALRTADNITTYRQICAAAAREHDLHACFMPKPFTGVSANGHHHHFTLVDRDGNNVFHDEDGPAQLSELGQQFMGGILDHFRALVCLGSPTVNSYKRMWDFGFWA
ncbi:MAG: glutamine synthetase family protein, partial [Actinomycetota bacterium]|nr:glutamine synthetase family protein [Actinomycetota bacterium]